MRFVSLNQSLADIVDPQKHQALPLPYHGVGLRTNLPDAEPLVDSLKLGHQPDRLSVDADVEKLVVRGVARSDR